MTAWVCDLCGLKSIDVHESGIHVGEKNGLLVVQGFYTCGCDRYLEKEQILFLLRNTLAREIRQDLRRAKQKKTLIRRFKNEGYTELQINEALAELLQRDLIHYKIKRTKKGEIKVLTQ